MMPLTLITYNIHKGLSPLNRHGILPGLAHALDRLNPDLLCLQEVQGEHHRRMARHGEAMPQAEFLAKALAHQPHYGPHAVYRTGHHGNAILARWPWDACQTHDLTLHRLEQRGLVHGHLTPPGWPLPLHIISCHLNLLERHRQSQLQRLMQYIETEIPADAALILAGDFNDWRKKAGARLEPIGLVDAHLALHGHPAKTFPARHPLLPLDRIYIRRLTLQQACAINTLPFPQLSDHLPLLIRFGPP